MGGVVDGTPVDAATTNPAFLDANGDDTALGKISFNDQAVNAPTVSGPAMVNIQREKNAIESWMGKSPGVAYNSLPTFTESEGFTSPQNFLGRLNALSRKFAKLVASGGHTHDGSDGGGAPIDSAAIANVVLHGYVRQAPLISGVTGSSTNVSSQFTGKFASGGDIVKGVVVLPPQNKVIIRQGSGADEGDEFVDGLGNTVFGRLTELTGVWTLSYFVNLSGVETAYSFSSSVDVILYYQELFNPIADAPIYSEYAVVPSENTTEDVVDATPTQRGLMSAGVQSLGGAKTWMGSQFFNGLAQFFAALIVEAKFYLVPNTNSTTTGTLATLPAPIKSSVRVTNASLVSIQEISGGSDGQLFVATNQTGADVTIKNAAGTVGNQIKTGSGFDFTWKNGSAVVFYYDQGSGFWYLTGGGGSGGIGYQESPSNPVNGINDTFGPFSRPPLTNESVLVYVDGILRPKSEYTIAANNVTFGAGNIPQPGQSVYFFFLSSGGAAPGPTFSGLLKTEFRTLTSGEITAKKLVLTETVASPGDALVDMIGGTSQEFNTDYTIVGDELRWNGYALDGQLVAGDKLRVHYSY